LDGDGQYDNGTEVDQDGDGRFDTIDERAVVESAANGGGLNGADFDFNGDNVITVAPYAFDIDGDGFEDIGNEVDLDGDGNFDTVDENIDGDFFLDNNGNLVANFELVNEDLDGDGQLDAFNEDVNGNGVLDNTVSRTYMTAFDPTSTTGGLQDLDIIVANALYVNGEQVVTSSTPLPAGSEGIVGVIEKRADGTIKLGENSFILDDTTASHVLTADGAATEIVLGGDAPGTAGVESVDIRVANNLDVDGTLTVGAIADVEGSINALATDDIAIRAEFAAADALLVADDAAIRAEFAAEDTAIRGEFATADALLQTQIDTNARGIANNRRDIESNTRGIAMVAALQTTTVLPGMTQALDISAAHFEGETGLAINYSRRINDNVQINFGAATTSDGDESVIKGGIGWQW
jgi:hypothetical protein